MSHLAYTPFPRYLFLAIMRKHDVIHKTGSTYITNRTAVMGKPNPRPSLTREKFFFNLHARGQTETDRDALIIHFLHRGAEL